MIAMARILVPTNLGEPSRSAVRYGVAFARQFGAQLILLHTMNAKDFEVAIEAERVLEQLVPATPGAPHPTRDEVVNAVARADLRRLLDADEERETRADYLLRPFTDGGPDSAIVACARELGVDLIIMGKHTIGRVEHLIAGSVTERTIRQAPCPVMILQHPQRDIVVEPPRPYAAEA